MNPKLSLITLVGFSTLVVFASCSPAEDRRSPSARATSLSEKISLHIADEFPAKPLLPEEEQLIAVATDRLIRACMAEAGFSYQIANSPMPAGTPDPYPDIEHLQRSAYGNDFEAQLRFDTSMSDHVEAYVESLPPEDQMQSYINALHGSHEERISLGDESQTVSGGGCFKSSIDKIYGSEYNLLWLAQIVELDGANQVARRLDDVPGYAVARGQWQDCMRSNGVSWMDGDKAWGQWDSGYYVLEQKMYKDDRAPNPFEIQSVVEADVECQKSSGIHEIRTLHLDEVKSELWESSEFSEAQKWRLQQYALAQAQAVD